MPSGVGVTVPRTVKVGFLSSTLKETGLTIEEFLELL
jgi:hypothetical protein